MANDPIRLAVTVEIYQPRSGGNLRLSESVELKQEISLAHAAELMGKISEVLKAVSTVAK